jgi:hypothetical protein
MCANTFTVSQASQSFVPNSSLELNSEVSIPALQKAAISRRQTKSTFSDAASTALLHDSMSLDWSIVAGPSHIKLYDAHQLQPLAVAVGFKLICSRSTLYDSRQLSNSSTRPEALGWSQSKQVPRETQLLQHPGSSQPRHCLVQYAGDLHTHGGCSQVAHPCRQGTEDSALLEDKRRGCHPASDPPKQL